jgi:hypothetical protein
MDAHYAACKQATDCIARQIITESDHQRANREVLASYIGRLCKYVFASCMCFCEFLRCIVLYRRRIVLLAFVELHGRKVKPPSVGRRAEPLSVGRRV